MKFIDSIKSDFVDLRNPRVNNPIEKYLKNNNLKMILALDNSKVVGYIAYDSNFHGNGLIIGIGVARKYRRRGIGRRLHKEAILDLGKVGIKKIIVRTWSTNNSSISLLKQLGFKKYRTIKNARVDCSNSLWFYLDRIF